MTLWASMTAALCGVFGCGPGSAAEAPKAAPAAGSLYDIAVRDIDGKEVTLGNYRGKVLLIVNVASRCGFTGQYSGLQKLYETYGERGFVVLGFPSNDFMGQEPGSNEEIKEFCSLTYRVTFPMFEKITVKGKGMHPLYRYLTEDASNPGHSGKITWNFNKFLVGRDGQVVARFGSRTAPEDKALIQALEKALSIST